MDIDRRKDEHIWKALWRGSQIGDTLLDDVILVHRALPELSLDDVETETEFLGIRISAPVAIGAMTGGTELAAKINARLASAAERLGIPIYVGSQRIAIERPETAWSFKIVKELAPSVPKIANLGGAQIARMSIDEVLDWANKAIDMIDAAALAIHLNPAQEAFQPEGDTDFRYVLDKLKIIKRRLNIPIIVKEVGSGISMEVAARVAPVADAIDVAGVGGTSFIAIEGERARERGLEYLGEMAKSFTTWGIPTAASICEVRSVYMGTVIASGGIRSGVDGAKAISLGADIFSLSRPLLEAAISNGVEQVLRRVIEELRRAMFLVGARRVEELKRAPKLIGPRLRHWLIERGLIC